MTRLLRWLPDLALLLAALLVVYGFYLAWPPLGWIVGGVALAVVVLLVVSTEKKRGAHESGSTVS